MGSVSKAIAAGLGGAVAGTGTGVVMLPEGSPWYAYLLLTLITAVIPLVATYVAPKNTN